MNPYLDRRQEYFRKYFDQGLTLDAFIRTGAPHHQERWNASLTRVVVPANSKAILESFRRQLNVLVLAGMWCGDCARQCPMFGKIEEVTPLVKFRYLDNGKNSDLADELRVNGALKVPTLVALSEDFYEVSRYADMPLGTYRRKAVRELGPSCDPGILPPPGEELSYECNEWVEYFERLQLMLRLAPALRKRYGD